MTRSIFTLWLLCLQPVMASTDIKLAIYTLNTQYGLGNDTAIAYTIDSNKRDPIGTAYVSFGKHYTLSRVNGISKEMVKGNVVCNIINEFTKIDHNIRIVAFNVTTYPYNTIVSNLYKTENCIEPFKINKIVNGQVVSEIKF